MNTKRTIRWTALTLALITCLGIGVLVSTEAGLRWVFGQLAGRIPGTLSAARLEGRLLGPFTISHLRYQHNGTTVELDSLTVDWQATGILGGALRVTRLRGHGLRIRLRKQKSVESPRQLSDFYLPLRLAVKDAVIDRISIVAGSRQEPVHLARAAFTLGIRGSNVSLAGLRVQATRFELAINGKLTSRGAYPMKLGVEWTLRPRGRAPVQGSGTLSGDLRELALQQSLVSPTHARLTGTLFDVVAGLHWRARLTVPSFEGRTLDPAWPEFSVAANLEGEGDLRSARVRGHFKGQVQALGKVEGRVLLQRKDTHLNLEELVLRIPDREARLQAHGQVAFDAESPRFSLTGDWAHLSWPMHGDAPRLTSRQGRFRVEGKLEGYTLQSELELSGRQLPAGQWTLSGLGDRAHVALRSIHGRILDGGIDGQARLEWLPRLSWKISFRGQRLNPGIRWPAWPGSLALRGQANGSLAGERSEIMLDLESVNGRLRGRPFLARVRAAMRGGGYRLSLLKVRAGSAQVDVSGTLDERVDIRWNLDVPRLGDLIPDSRGTVRSHGFLRGVSRGPVIEGQVKAAGVAVGASGARGLDATWLLDLQNRGASSLKLRADKVWLRGLHVGDVSIHGVGTAHQHRLTLTVRNGRQSADVALVASFARGRWSGLLEALHVDDPAAGKWTLEHPARYEVSLQNASIEQSCLRSAAARGCFTGEWGRSTGWSATASADNFPLRALQGVMRPELQMKGTVNAHAAIAYRAGVWSALNADLELNPGGATVQTDAGQVLHWRYKGGALHLRKENNKLDAKFALALQGSDRVRGELSVPIAKLSRREIGAAPLSGSLHADIRNLGVVELFAPEAQGVQGHLVADLSMGGTVLRPVTTARATLDQGAFTIPRIGLKVRELRLGTESAGPTALRVSGEARAGKGTIKVEGRVQFGGASVWSANLTVRGNDFEAVRIPEAWVLVSPDLNLHIRPRRIDLTGEVKIPAARLQPQDTTGAVVPSPDVVVIGADTIRVREPRWKIFADVRLTVADNVGFKGYGFNGRVGGSLVLRDRPGKVTTARGELRVVEGTYKAYGQTLKVDSGQLLFADGPVDNPGLDLSATRDIGTVTAGARVRGTVSQPELSLFSTPAMAQADILSYLVLGRPVSQATQAEGRSLVNAASTVGLVGGDALAGWIGKRLGLKDVRVESEPNSQQPWLTVGTYLSPKLYVSYGLGLFEPGSSLRIRYRLSSKWTLQGESGRQSGADLLYTIEH